MSYQTLIEIKGVMIAHPRFRTPEEIAHGLEWKADQLRRLARNGREADSIMLMDSASILSGLAQNIQDGKYTVRKGPPL